MKNDTPENGESRITCEVLILGKKGYGKTLYLAGLHGVMGPGQHEIAATLQTSAEFRLALDKIYGQAVGVSTDFPPSNPWGVVEWPFDCVITGAKVPGARVQPLNIVVPFAALLPDILRQRPGAPDPTVSQAGNATKSPVRTVVKLLPGFLARRREMQNYVEGPVVRITSKLIHQVSGKRLAQGPAERIAEAAVTFVNNYLDGIEKRFAENAEQLRRDLLLAERKVADEQAAIHLATQSCYARLLEFERDYPESVLSGGRP